MTVTLKGVSGEEYDFDIYTDKGSLPRNSGVYALLCHKHSEKHHYSILYIGEAGNVHERLTSGNHNGLKCAEKVCSNVLHFGVYDTIDLSRKERLEIEKDLTNKYNPPCNNQ